MTGKVKWFDNSAGYGFIKYTEKDDVFVHYSMIKIEGYKTLEKDQTVDFTLVETEKGFQATDVSIIKEKELATVN